MHIIICKPRAFVYPEGDEVKEEAVVKAAKDFKIRPKKKQAHYKRPRGGSRGVRKVCF